MSQDPFENAPVEHRPPSNSSKSPLLLILGIVGGVCLFMCLIIGGLAALLIPDIQGARSAARRSMSRNNLKQIGLAMHNYHDVHKTFPPGATVDAEGLSHHSWITQILPYVDQIHLFNSINTDYPWDDPANAGHFFRELPVFLNPAIDERMTLDGYGMSHYAGNASILFDNSQIQIRDIHDGTSNTIMAGEINENFPAWGDPANRRDPSDGINKSPDGFGSPFEGGAQFLLIDGHVRFINENIDPEILKALSTHKGGEVVGEY